MAKPLLLGALDLAPEGWGCCYTPTLPKTASVDEVKTADVFDFSCLYFCPLIPSMSSVIGGLNLNCREVITRLIKQGVVSDQRAAHATAIYFQLWREGEVFNLDDRSVQTHRARLRKIGLDIAKPYEGF